MPPYDLVFPHFQRCISSFYSLKFQFQLSFFICLTNDFDSLPQGESCRDFVGLLWIGFFLRVRDREPEAGSKREGG